MQYNIAWSTRLYNKHFISPKVIPKDANNISINIVLMLFSLVIEIFSYSFL